MLRSQSGVQFNPRYNSNCIKERSSSTIQVPATIKTVPGTVLNPPTPRTLKHQLSPSVDLATISSVTSLDSESFSVSFGKFCCRVGVGRAHTAPWPAPFKSRSTRPLSRAHIANTTCVVGRGRSYPWDGRRGNPARETATRAKFVQDTEAESVRPLWTRWARPIRCGRCYLPRQT